jgi:hypothetical protein
MRQKSVTFSMGALPILVLVFVSAWIVLGVSRTPVSQKAIGVENPVRTTPAPASQPMDKSHPPVAAGQNLQSQTPMDIQPEWDPSHVHDESTYDSENADVVVFAVIMYLCPEEPPENWRQA